MVRMMRLKRAASALRLPREGSLPFNGMAQISVDEPHWWPVFVAWPKVRLVRARRAFLLLALVIIFLVRGCALFASAALPRLLAD